MWRASKIGLSALLIIAVTALVIAQNSKSGSPRGVEWQADSQGVGEDAAYLMNLADAPLTLSITENGRHLLLSNRTTKLIVGYQLGTVVKRKGILNIVRVTRPITIKLDVHEAAINPKEVEVELAYCRKRMAKLIVVKILFADGKLWEGRIRFNGRRI